MTFFNAYDNIEVDSRLVNWSQRLGITDSSKEGRQNYVEVLAKDADDLIGKTFELPAGKKGHRVNPRRRNDVTPKSYRLFVITTESKGKVFKRRDIKGVEQEYVRLYGENKFVEVKE